MYFEIFAIIMKIKNKKIYIIHILLKKIKYHKIYRLRKKKEKKKMSTLFLKFEIMQNKTFKLI